MTSLVQHAFHGQAVRVITDEHGEPWFVVNDLCSVLGIANVGNVLSRLDDDMKGSVRLADGTPGNPNRATVSEPGMYEVILRSDSPNARSFRRWVTTDVLPTIRRTGHYGTGMDLDDPANVGLVIEAASRAWARVKELEPPAAAWQAMVETHGDYSLRDAAQILARDHGIDVGQNRLAKRLQHFGWVDKSGRPYQRVVDAGWVCRRMQTRVHPHTGQRVTAEPQTRITTKGIGQLHKLMGGSVPLVSAERALEVAR
jgi:prophage antirepressor-like protein